jgi:hypothetical protein
MKLKHIAISAFALSMGAAFAAGNATDMNLDKNKPATAAENSAAPAGYADKSAAAQPMTGQKDTRKAQKKHKKAATADAGVATTNTARADQPAGYSDKAKTDKKMDEPKDTAAAQQQPDAGLGAATAAPARSGAPAGYADQSPAATGSQPQDTQKAQSK